MMNESEKWTSSIKVTEQEVTEGLLEMEEEYTPHYDTESTLRAKQIAEKSSSNNLICYAGKY